MDPKPKNAMALEDRLHDEMIDAVDEELELEIDDSRLEGLLAEMPAKSPGTPSIAIPISRNCCVCRRS